MSVLDVLDATRICGRWSTSLDDPEAWILPGPAVTRRQPITTPKGDYSWLALARNPRAMLLTGMAAPLIAVEAVRRGIPAR